MRPLTIPTRRRLGLRTLGAAALLTFSGLACAQSIDQRTGVEELVEMLDAPAFADRDAARSALNQHPGLTDQRAIGLMRDGTLSPEQRLALDAILFERFAMSPVGAIGVSFMGTAQEDRGLTINVVTDGFPAIDQKLIQVGDVITRVDGVDIGAIISDPGQALMPDGRQVPEITRLSMARSAATRTVQSHVFSRQPGERLPVTLVRSVDGQEREIAVEIPLGDISQHTNAARTDHVVHDAFRIRMARETGLTVETPMALPTDSTFWPQPVSAPPRRFAVNRVVEGPTPLATIYNRFDPYAPVHEQDAIRRTFEEFDHLLSMQEADGNAVAQRRAFEQIKPPDVGNQRAAQLRPVRAVRAMDAKIEGQFVARGVPSQRVPLTPPPGPVLDEIAQLRTQMSSLSRRIVETTDEPTRTRLRERLDEAARSLDSLNAELDVRFVLLNRLREQQQRQNARRLDR